MPLEHFVLQLDEVLIASSNEKHLAAFKELPDFASFKGRIELVRVPYLRRYRVEQEIYDAQVTATTVGKHVAPHATEVAAMWAVLTRLKKPIPDRYPREVRELVDRLTPAREAAPLRGRGARPTGSALAQAQGAARSTSPTLYEESDAYPNYEGRSGASAREIKTALFNAAQNPDYHVPARRSRCSRSSRRSARTRASTSSSSRRSWTATTTTRSSCASVEGEYLDVVDEEVRDSMGLVSEGQYRELFERYVQHVSHWVKGEKMREPASPARWSSPDESRMAEMEAIVMPKGEDAGEFRRGLIAQIGAHKLDNPDVAMDYPRIFPDLFRRLRDHFFEERKRHAAQEQGERPQVPLRRSRPALAEGAGAGRGDARRRWRRSTATASTARRTRSCS